MSAYVLPPSSLGPSPSSVPSITEHSIYFHPLGPSIHPHILHIFHLPIVPSINMSDSETVAIIQPLFSKLEECLDLNPILGKLYSNNLFKTYHMQTYRSLKDNRIEQNRAFLDYLLTQPVEQVKKFCQVLQEDACNASHQELAAEMLKATPPADPWKCISGLLHIIANQFSQSLDCLKQTMVQYQISYPQQPSIFLAHLLIYVEVFVQLGVPGATPVRNEILRVYQSLSR